MREALQQRLHILFIVVGKGKLIGQMLSFFPSNSLQMLIDVTFSFNLNLGLCSGLFYLGP